jgi:hypothetical protein
VKGSQFSRLINESQLMFSGYLFDALVPKSSVQVVVSI